jgi:Ring finger domain
MASALSNFHLRSRSSPRHTPLSNEDHDDEEQMHDDIEHQADSTTERDSTPLRDETPLSNSDDQDLEEPPILRPPSIVNTTLRELEEEREMARRRTSVCMVLGVCLLFRLWIEALTQADFGLLMLCLIGTSWCARFIRYNREREEELDRRIQAFLENPNEEAVEVRPDFRMLSFQAQLALAIMESQRQMMQGGYGNPDGHAAGEGVSEDTRSKWERFKFKTVGDLESKKVDENDLTDNPSCTICLGDYENSEELVKLPCGHFYHGECIDAWTANHSKCPLCNFNLEAGDSDL